MRLGVCTNFLSEDKYSLHLEALSEMSGNFDFIEFPAFPIMDLSESAFDEFVLLLKEKRVSTDSITNLFPGDIRIMDDLLEKNQIRDYLAELAERICRMGARKIVFGSGVSRKLPEGRTKEWGDERMNLVLSSFVLPAFSRLGIKVLLEPLNPSLCNYMNTIGEAAVFCDSQKNDDLGIVADSFNLMWFPDTPDEINRFGSFISHVHISEKNRAFPRKMEGSFELFLDALHAIGYDGDYSLECRLELSKLNEFSHAMKNMIEHKKEGTI